MSKFQEINDKIRQSQEMLQADIECYRKIIWENKTRIMALKRVSYIILFILLMFIITDCVFSKVNRLPMKVYRVIDIPDGEYLRYGSYKGGEKISDIYFVTRILTNADGNSLYNIYVETININDKKKLNTNYETWPSVLKIDPKMGSVIEAIQQFNTNKIQMENISAYGMGKTVYQYYKINFEKSTAEVLTKNIDKGQISEKTSTVKVQLNYPLWTGVVMVLYLPRFLNFKDGGVFYIVEPEFFKQPLPNTCIVDSKVDVETKMGILKAYKLRWVQSDPFLNRLMGPIMDKAGHYVEDSSRKIVIKAVSPIDKSEITILEEISNVIGGQKK